MYKPVVGYIQETLVVDSMLRNTEEIVKRKLSEVFFTVLPEPAAQHYCMLHLGTSIVVYHRQMVSLLLFI